MTRLSLSTLVSKQEQRLREVWDWYEFQRLILGEEKSRVLESIANGSIQTSSRYADRTLDELHETFEYQNAELALMTMLGLLASTEAALWVDFIDRVKNKKKDDVSRHFRRVFTGKKHKIKNVRFEEDILETWRDRGAKTGIKRAVMDLKGTLKLRHWLAHGRYWKPKLGRASGYDTADVFEICKAVLQAVDLMAPDIAAH